MNSSLPIGPSSGRRSGACSLVAQLRVHGVRRVYCVPGESYLSVLDALHDAHEIQVVTCRHESGAAMMAEAHGKLTGLPGICMVTRGPGATNASAGVHIAAQDSTPMILFVGQVARGMREREAFQELDYRQVFGSMAKWVAEIDDANRIPELLSRAFHIATNGRPGPVVLALPEDMLVDMTDVADAAPFRPLRTTPDPQALSELANRLMQAERPMILAGGSRWDEDAVASLERVAERACLPVATTFRRQDRFDNTHDHFVGDVGIGINPSLAERVRASDLLLVIGSRLGEMATSGYSLIDIPLPEQILVHVHADVNELGRVYQPDLGIHADASSFCRELERLELAPRDSWRGWVQEARQAYLETLKPTVAPGDLNMAEVMRWLSTQLPPNATICNGAGNFSTWVHRFFQYQRLGSQLAPNSGSMGYGLPAAIAAKLENPERCVVCVAGDGDLMMTVQELATAIQYRAKIIVLVVNNGMYGTIRMHQERHYPGRVFATELTNPDFVMLGQSYGLLAQRVQRTSEFAMAFDRAQSHDGPSLIELRVDPEALTPRQSLSAIRSAAQAQQPSH